jgi:hypothetical protein
MAVQTEVDFYRYAAFQREHFYTNYGQAVALSILIGLAAFLAVVGSSALNPYNIAWLQQGDSALHYLGWKFFATTPWNWPPGASPRYGLDLSSGVFYADAIPLVALVFKLFGTASGSEFQYFGIWLLSCFCLQFLAGFVLVGSVTGTVWLRTVMATFFVFAPFLLWRLNGHEALFGQFLIILALHLNLTGHRGRWRAAWPLLIGVTSLVHGYILAMVGALWVSDLANRALRRDISALGVVREVLIVIVTLLLALWMAGFFTLEGGFSDFGYGQYRMDLLSLLNSAGWSYLMRTLPSEDGELEGFSFPGLGILLALILVAGARAGARGQQLGILRLPAPLLVILLLLLLTAITNKISIGTTELVVPLPEQILNLVSILRASGRFVWPVMYLVYFLIFVGVLRMFGERRGGAILGICLAVQIADTSAGWRQIHASKGAVSGSTWQGLDNTAFWNDAAKRYANLRVVPQGPILKKWARLSLFAADNGMGTDAAAFGRADPEKWLAAHLRTVTEIESGKYRADSLYVLDDGWAARALLKLDPTHDTLTRIDGLNLLLPGYANCGNCPVVKPLIATDLAASLPLGTDITFADGGTGLSLLHHGWLPPEKWGAWSIGKSATVVVSVPESAATGKLRLSIGAQGMFGGKEPVRTVKVAVNGVPAGSLRFDAVYDLGWRSLDIPADAAAHDPLGILVITFDIDHPSSSIDMGIGLDQRQLGIGLVALRVDIIP